jgi:hypothetical protein
LQLEPNKDHNCHPTGITIKDLNKSPKPPQSHADNVCTKHQSLSI